MGILRDERVALEERTVRRMRLAAVLLDTDRVMSGAAGRLSFHAPEYSGEIPLEEWLDARVDQAILDLKVEDEYQAADGFQVASGDPRYAALARQLDVDAATMRQGSIVFHRLPDEERAVFWAVLIDGLSVESHAARTQVPVRVANQRFERAVTTFCSLGAHRHPPDRGGSARQQGEQR